MYLFLNLYIDYIDKYFFGSKNNCYSYYHILSIRFKWHIELFINTLKDSLDSTLQTKYNFNNSKNLPKLLTIDYLKDFAKIINTNRFLLYLT